MIEQDQIASILLKACPSFQEAWRVHVEGNGENLIYPVLGSFAAHLLQLYREGKRESFVAIGEAIERLHLDGSPFTTEAATMGILEGIQNVWANSGVDPELFHPYLGPESARYWQSLKDFWAGKVPYVGYHG